MCEVKKGDSTPTVLAMVKKNSRGLRRGYIINFDEASESIQTAIADAERVIKQKIRKITLGIGGATLESKLVDGTIAVSRPDAEINELEINRCIESTETTLPDIKNKQILHRIPVAFKLDNKRILGRPEGLQGSKLEAKILFVTYSAQHLKDLVKAVEDSGVIIEDIVASPLAASFSTLTKIQKVSGCVLINIGSQTTSIAIFEEGLPISIQIFPLGSTDITNDIALGFRIPLEDAERIKKGEGEGAITKKKLDEIIQARLSDIFELIESHLKKMGLSGLLPAGVVITGGGSNISNIEDLTKSYFKLPAKIASPEIGMISKNQIKDTVWSVAYGLCIFALLDGEVSNPRQHSSASNRYPIWSWIKSIIRELWP